MLNTLDGLIEHLTDLRDSEGLPGDTEVRLAIQPAWAFEHSIDAVAAVQPGDEGEPGRTAAVVYIGEGRQLGYLPGDAARELGWRSA